MIAFFHLGPLNEDAADCDHLKLRHLWPKSRHTAADKSILSVLSGYYDSLEIIIVRISNMEIVNYQIFLC